ncbi:hypothetical protein [uncultured Gammaproteobacteria bacterium]|nr:hypothetical protein [uncultured Gammaproteobacteria bacterium]VVH54820.1 hypothetical protein BAZOLSSOX_1842 [uncultured Gammaproteobacteria bacterium]
MGFVCFFGFYFWIGVSCLPSFWWKIRYFMGFINYIGLMQESRIYEYSY